MSSTSKRARRIGIAARSADPGTAATSPIWRSPPRDLSDPARIRALNRPIVSRVRPEPSREDLPRLTYSPGDRARIARA
jgi:hypothetical protein